MAASFDRHWEPRLTLRAGSTEANDGPSWQTCWPEWRGAPSMHHGCIGCWTSAAGWIRRLTKTTTGLATRHEGWPGLGLRGSAARRCRLGGGERGALVRPADQRRERLAP